VKASLSAAKFCFDFADFDVYDFVSWTSMSILFVNCFLFEMYALCNPNVKISLFRLLPILFFVGNYLISVDFCLISVFSDQC